MLDHAGLRPAVPRPAAGKPFELAPTVVRWSDANYIEDRDHWYHAGVRTAARYVFGSRTRRAEIDAGNVEPWSAESPRLFDLDVQLFDADGKKVDGVVARVGFRRVEVRGAELLINGKPVLIKGVNRHDHDMRNGKAVRTPITRTTATCTRSATGPGTYTWSYRLSWSN